MTEYKISLLKNGAVKLPGPLLFGYEKNKGNYRLRVTATGEWQGLTIRACWHPPGNRVPPASLVENGVLEVPGAATACRGEGCITFEGSNGERTVTSADVHYRVAANSGTEDGTAPAPGTPAWEAFIAAMREAAGGLTGTEKQLLLTILAAAATSAAAVSAYNALAKLWGGTPMQDDTAVLGRAVLGRMKLGRS